MKMDTKREEAKKSFNIRDILNIEEEGIPETQGGHDPRYTG